MFPRSTAGAAKMTSIIASRHIRHDFKTWVDWEQKSVRTLCGVTTRRHLAGIPAVNSQPIIVGDLWGWCAGCVFTAYAEIDTAIKTKHYNIMPPHIVSIYSQAEVCLRPQWEWMTENNLVYRPRLAQKAPPEVK